MSVLAATPKDKLRELAQSAGCAKHQLLALAPQHDPYNCGSETDIVKGRWVKEQLDKLNLAAGFHLRKLHYVLVVQPTPVLMWNGQPYQNTESCWKELSSAGKAARYLGFCDPHDFTDQRNPDPELLAPEPKEPDEPSWSVEEFFEFFVPEVHTNLQVDVSIPDALVSGFDYDAGEQPTIAELWIEKSTLAAELRPLCRELGLNYVSSAGFQSITSAVALLSRAAKLCEIGRSVRILYISDFDPAGDTMPRAVARQIQFWHEEFGLDADIALHPIALTREQVQRYSLPRIPIKDTDVRKASFETRHGEGAVELDALEALYPGELARIIRATVAQYRDESLQARLSSADYLAKLKVNQAWRAATEPYRQRARQLEKQAEKVIKKYRRRLERMRDKMNEEMGPVTKEIKSLECEVIELVDNAPDLIDVDLPVRPTAEVETPDESHFLYHSHRSFFEQLDHFKQHKNGEQ